MKCSVQGVTPVANDDGKEEICVDGQMGGRVMPVNVVSLSSLSQRRTLMKCACLWRSIILSSLGKTLYPYSQYIRTLNLGDLEVLFTEFEFRIGISR